jgi:transcriptional regulator with XRE-family HTH domain
MDPAVAFGKILRTVRKEAMLTQAQLALAADVERNFVSLMERGINQPTVRIIFKLARALGTTPSAMLRLVEKEVVLHDDLKG